MLAKFSGFEFESFEKEKENFCVVFTYFIKREHETRKFHVAVVQQRLRACLHGVGEPGLVGLVSFVFTLWGTQNKRNLPH